MGSINRRGVAGMVGAEVGVNDDGTLPRQYFGGPGITGGPHQGEIEKSSWHQKELVTLDTKSFVHCTSVYFKTGNWLLGPDDRRALAETARTLRTFLVHGTQVEVRCSGRADVRADQASNEALSQRRLFIVEEFLKNRLNHLKGWTMLEGSALGERYSSSSESMWAEDRRVELQVRVIPEAAREQEENPWVKTRIRIFELYYPRYKLWPDRRLEYLVRQYEENDQDDYPVTIADADFERVLDLVHQIAEPDDWRKISVWAATASSPRERRNVISDIYCVEYRRAYRQAYDLYRNSKEYGKLSP